MSSFQKEFEIQLDHDALLFQNLNGAYEDVDLDFSYSDEPQIRNLAYGTRPLIIHGNGASKVVS